MEEERTIKELLQLMLDNQQLFRRSLCHWISELLWKRLISYKEHLILRKYIDENRPSKYSSFSAYKSRYSAFYWKRGIIKYRIKWLNKHIAKL